ncbi:TRAP-type C4-dicarboxylate transport system, substrate-binding protein [Pilibacter termitis]|uniref:TRAP-type C4-dicarboxylate transport system, substrate-binding protein n=1 Tax=Pilibacter termitis TaxID=263852 RepID=A0A1T4K572_9ENTE|nr:C4-dicarboxylate TRAP transporter substrate-binding protein [Pilibacter termitis]SJZ37465.1 TRAP-type C4-dicarboxylate transport system, substrate-binding protein [Pilibacter termitis]
MKKFYLTIVTLMLLVVSGCGASKDKADASRVYTLKMSTQLNETHPIVEGLKEWSKRVADKTDSRLKIEILPSGQLGTDEDIIEQAMLGVNVAILTDGGRMSDYVHDIGIVGMPYIGDNYDDMRKITETTTFKGFEKELTKKAGIYPIAFNWYDGPRHYLTNKPIKEPKDLKSERIRTPSAPTWSVSVSKMGGTPINMPWSETYNGIQSKAADGAEAQYTAIYTSRMFEVARYVNKTGHFQLLNGIICGEKWIKTLPKEFQEILIEECKATAADNAKYVESKQLEYEDLMKKEKVEIITPDVEAFKKASEESYKELGFEDLRKQIWSEIGKGQ